jgi:hypothetical protein
MAILELKSCEGYLHFDRAQCLEEGAKRAETYRSAKPFPHIVMEDFLDTSVLREVAAGYPPRDGRTFFDRDQERFKYQYDPNTVESFRVRNILNELNGEPFIAFLAKMTGIEGLIPDPYFMGGGLHETLSGGHLSVHADFNVHEQMQLERRLNLLVYLNDDWPESYGGHLELWDEKMTACEASVLPVIGRAVVFNTTLRSYHGQPDPVACPPDRARRSIATYYYTALPAETTLPTRTTTFQTRPESGDKTDWKVGYGHFVQDWVPKRLQRYAMRLVR